MMIHSIRKCTVSNNLYITNQKTFVCRQLQSEQKSTPLIFLCTRILRVWVSWWNWMVFFLCWEVIRPSRIIRLDDARDGRRADGWTSRLSTSRRAAFSLLAMFSCVRDSDAGGECAPRRRPGFYFVYEAFLRERWAHQIQTVNVNMKRFKS